jgi:hypothetical protein
MECVVHITGKVGDKDSVTIGLGPMVIQNGSVTLDCMRDFPLFCRIRCDSVHVTSHRSD